VESVSTLAPDVAMRRLLRVPSEDQLADSGGEPRAATAAADAEATARAHRLFSTSILLSAARCLLGYVVFPIVSPALGAAAGVGPAVGIPLGVLALVFDVRGIRRFWLANHRYRWAITGLYLVVMVLVTVLLVKDLIRIS
jgi:membrane-bound metal-dependent hydrolase YbcI (DUF457 family)